MRRALAAAGLCTLLGACDSQPGAGLVPFPSDGVSGFGEVALVDVCIGGARAVPGGASAVCVPDGVTAQACSGDEQCALPERCVCARCIVLACDATTVCPSGEACRGGRCTPGCTEDQDCKTGQICNGGGCTRACDSDSQCSAGETCSFLGTCTAKPCGDGAMCGSGYTCEAVAIDGDVREPTIASVSGADVVFFELRSEGSAAVYRARFEGPLHLTADPIEPVLTAPAGEKKVGAPSAIAHGDHVDLFVAVGAGKSLGLATSENGGRSFSWVSEKVLAPSASWEAGAVSSPGAFEHEGATFVFYEGGAGAGIGLAKLDGGSLARLVETPVLVGADLEDASFWRSVKAIGTPFAIADASSVRLYVTARGIEAGTALSQSGPIFAAPNDSIGFFATVDLAKLDRYPTGPVFATTAGLTGSLGEREPALRRMPEGADLYFVATDASGASPSGLARASTLR